MKYQIHAIATSDVTIEIEADSPGEAVEKFLEEDFKLRDIETWNTEYNLVDV